MKLDFGTVSERDMDILFLNAFSTIKDFLELFVNKTDLPKKEYLIEEISLSKSDKDGESDIIVVIGADDKKYGLLIEDKIDAQAMQEQHKRYTIRGNKAVKKHEFDDYRDFIVCSKKYYEVTITIYSHMQACGMINDHDRSCPCYKKINSKYPTIGKKRYLEKGINYYGEK